MSLSAAVVPNTGGLAAQGLIARKPPGVFRESLRLGRTKIGLALTGILAAIAVFGPLVAPFGETAFVGIASQVTVDNTTLGADYLGQDVLSRFLFGGRSILLLAVAATVLGVGLGTLLGLFAAYARGIVDELLMRSLDVILAFPQILVSLLVIAMFDPSAIILILTIGLTTVPRVARVVRGAAMQVVERDFVAAAEALGESRLRVLFRELLPNVSGTVLVEANLRLTYSIGAIAGLAFLGFTPSLNSANWGLMIQENRGAMSVQPWPVILPAVAIALLTIGTGLIADGIARTVAGIERTKADV
jgi:peptide/nickel transport system permease protein